MQPRRWLVLSYSGRVVGLWLCVFRPVEAQPTGCPLRKFAQARCGLDSGGNANQLPFQFVGKDNTIGCWCIVIGKTICFVLHAEH